MGQKAARVTQALSNRHSVIQELVRGPGGGGYASPGVGQAPHKIEKKIRFKLRFASFRIYTLYIYILAAKITIWTLYVNQASPVFNIVIF